MTQDTQASTEGAAPRIGSGSATSRFASSFSGNLVTAAAWSHAKALRSYTGDQNRMLPPATQLGESPIATPLPVASAGNNHVAISLSSLDRAFPDQALRQILSRSPVLKTVLNDCALTVEHELLQIKVPFAVRASVETDPEEGRTRYVLRVIAPNLDFRSKMDLWTRIADELRLARKQAMTEIRPPRLAAREAWSDVMIHFDLD